MPFVRLAGCQVGCPLCDTDYGAVEHLTAGLIRERVQNLTPRNLRDRWVWITGGEPTDYNLKPLLDELHDAGYSIAVATSGHHRMIEPVEWLSVSPHDPEKWVQKFGSELKIVEGLIPGTKFEDFQAAAPESDFMYRFAQPLWKNGKEDPESLNRCLWWCETHPNWTISRQEHKQYGYA